MLAESLDIGYAIYMYVNIKYDSDRRNEQANCFAFIKGKTKSQIRKENVSHRILAATHNIFVTKIKDKPLLGKSR